MDVNEKIVECWLNNCKNIFTISNVEYNSHHAAIDLLGIDLKNKEVLDIEVKFKSGISINNSVKKENGFLHIKKQLINKNREETIKRLLLDNHKFKIKKLLITTKKFLTAKKFKYWNKRFKQNGIELEYFENIIAELSNKAKKMTKASDEILQALRIINQFGAK